MAELEGPVATGAFVADSEPRSGGRLQADLAARGPDEFVAGGNRRP